MSALYDVLVDPIDVRSWLEARNWTPLGGGGGNGRLWTQGREQILQPLATDAADYERRLRELVDRLARTSQLEPEEVVREIHFQGNDVSEWRASGTARSSLALDDAERLIGGARAAFTAAASATLHRRAYFGHSITKQAREHSRRIRMAHTREGSYVIPILSPVVTDADLPQHLALDVAVEAQPFERRVMAQLSDGLTAVSQLIDGDRVPRTSELLERVGAGVSYELCSALSRTLTSQSYETLGVSFAWSSRLSSRRGDIKVEFPTAAQPVLEEMANHLRGREEVGMQALVGTIHGHVHRENSGGGSLTINALIGGSRRLVGMELDEADLSVALDAASRRQPVIAEGRLLKPAGRRWSLENLRGFGTAAMLPSDLVDQ